jgi:hypothetical protein
MHTHHDSLVEIHSTEPGTVYFLEQPDHDFHARLDPRLHQYELNTGGTSFVSAVNGDIGIKDSDVQAHGNTDNTEMDIDMGMDMDMEWMGPSPPVGESSCGYDGYLGDVNNTPGFKENFGEGVSPGSFTTTLLPPANSVPRDPGESFSLMGGIAGSAT